MLKQHKDVFTHTLVYDEQLMSTVFCIQWYITNACTKEELFLKTADYKTTMYEVLSRALNFSHQMEAL